jgi:Xaa-Pro aminopeptidase
MENVNLAQVLQPLLEVHQDHSSLWRVSRGHPAHDLALNYQAFFSYRKRTIWISCMIDTILDRYSLRLKNIRQAITNIKIDGFLVTDLINVRYLTGFTGSSGFAFVTGKETFFITDFRYKEQSEKEVKHATIIIEKGDRFRIIQTLSKKNHIRSLGFESSVSYAFHKKLLQSGLRLHAVEGLIEKLRTIKDISEIGAIQEAVKRAETAFLEVRPYIKLGIKEHAIALRLEERLKRKGCSHIPFEIIVASGAHSSMPHARSTEKKLSQGDFVIIDWGGEAHGYFSDMTRTFIMRGGNTFSRQREIYNIVLEANRKAISSVTQGMKTKEVDRVARDFIRNAGYGEYFGHGTGHGVGLQVHEAPRVTWSRSQPIRENMVFTVEPGIYIPDFGGVRIEDMVVVKNKKALVLTSLPKKLEVI